MYNSFIYLSIYLFFLLYMYYFDICIILKSTLSVNIALKTYLISII